MSTDPTILSCLMQVTEADALQLFDRVVVQYNEEQRECYICLGKHSVYFVSSHLASLVFGGALSYLDIEKAALCTKTNRRLLLQLKYDHSDDWEDDKLIIKSDFRQLLIERLSVCWQAEFMYTNFQVKRFPIAKIDNLPLPSNEELSNIDNLLIHPFQGYESNFAFRGYTFFLRKGFRDFSGTRSGMYRHPDGWTVPYGFASNKIIIPPDIVVQVHVSDAVSILELEQDHTRDEVRTVATNYRIALCEGLDQVYILVNNAYMKRLNRTNDMASWDGWELLVRSKDSCFVCVIMRRMFIPPLCDTCQDVAVMMRCPASPSMPWDTHDVLMDECRHIADSIAAQTEVTHPDQLYTSMIQSRLNSLHFNEDAYLWLQGHLMLEPVHELFMRNFIKSLIMILEGEAQNYDEYILQDPELDNDVVTYEANPMQLVNTLLTDYQDVLGQTGSYENLERTEKFKQRISRYLAFAIDGGKFGDRFTLTTIVSAVGKCFVETDKLLRQVVEFLLNAHTTSKRAGTSRTPLMQLLSDPDLFASCEFNERVMRVLLVDNYIQNEWRKRQSSPNSVHYEKLLAALLQNDKVGLALRTLICRQILELVSVSGASLNKEAQIEVLVPALVKVLDNRSVALASCATAALVNLSCDCMHTKSMLVQTGAVKLMLNSLQRKDDDLTLYTLYLLVNMSKLPQHRMVIISNGGLPLLVDIMSSSYQNLRKVKILAELASVFGQLCNEGDTRSLMSDEYPVCSCLLWIFDAAEPNSKLKTKVLFALRQLCGSIPRLIKGPSRGGTLAEAQNKIKVGQHVIYTVIEELGMATRHHGECAMNAVLLLIVLSSVDSNAKLMSQTLKQELLHAKIMEARQYGKPAILSNKGRFSAELIDKVAQLLETVNAAVAKDM